MAYEIEDGVPVALKNARDNTVAGTLRHMMPGQSFFVSDKRMKSVSAMASKAAHDIGNKAKFVTRSVEEKGVRGVRVWRVS